MDPRSWRHLLRKYGPGTLGRRRHGFYTGRTTRAAQDGGCGGIWIWEGVAVTGEGRRRHPFPSRPMPVCSAKRRRAEWLLHKNNQGRRARDLRFSMGPSGLCLSFCFDFLPLLDSSHQTGSRVQFRSCSPCHRCIAVSLISLALSFDWHRQLKHWMLGSD
jgi:hypothetical protein